MWHFKHFFQLMIGELFRSDNFKDKAFKTQHGIERKDA